jgi:diaminopropionate ammonia-lyase
MVALTIEFEKNKNKNLNKNSDGLKFDLKKVENFHKSMWGYYHKTPLIELKELAKYLGVKNILVKDESKRFGLKSFKALGSSYAIASYLAKKEGKSIEDICFDDIARDSVSGKKRNIVFCTASDGNHGLGVAWMSRLIGAKCVVYVPNTVSENRINNIIKQEAEVKVIDSNYDLTVEKIKDDAKKNNWVLIQDTALDGYELMPQLVMEGYSTVFSEIISDLTAEPTHIFLQTGVGSMAASMMSNFIYNAKTKPKFISVEPNKADCLYQSIQNGKMVQINGKMDTIMGGLACGKVNYLVWDFFKNNLDYAISCKEGVAALGMRALGNPLGADEKIVAGESGALPAGVLVMLKKYYNVKSELKLDKDSVILLINTEGDTDENSYRDIVWGGEYPIKYRSNTL